jgi:hypothetical protein
VHGNLVRVEQLMMRPNAQTVQIVDLVQRPTFTYNDSQFSSLKDAQAYFGAGSGGIVQTNRLDALMATLSFNSNLPQQMGAWPDFFKSNSPQTLSAVFANMSAVPTIMNSGDIFEMAFVGQRDVNGNLNTNLYVGRLNIKDGSCTSTADCVAGMTDFSNARRRFDEFTQQGHSIEQTIPGSLAEYTATPYFQTQTVGIGTVGPTVWLVQNNFGIDNNGQIRSLGDFTNSSASPFATLAKTGMETIMQLKSQVVINTAGPNLLAGGDYNDFGHTSTATSIDLVVIPDLPMAALTQIALSGSNFKTQ